MYLVHVPSLTLCFLYIHLRLSPISVLNCKMHNGGPRVNKALGWCVSRGALTAFRQKGVAIREIEDQAVKGKRHHF